MNNYDDIIFLEHHVSTFHKPMSIENRAAQFAPFSALVGYNDQIKETARLTSRKLDIDEETKNNINFTLEIIQNSIKEKPLVKIEYFVKDLKKEGGSYNTIIDNVKRIDTVLKCIKLNNNIIYLNDIIFIEIINKMI